MTHDQKIEKWAERELKRNIDHLILDNQEGCILAFGVFSIVPEQAGVAVHKDGELVASFSSRKVALSWCVARHRNMLNLSDHIRILDKRNQEIRDDIRASRTMITRTHNTNLAGLITSKVETKQWYANMLKCELEKCVQRAKYLQLRGINNETARTRAA